MGACREKPYINQYQRDWYAKNRARSLEHKRAWRKAHPEAMARIYRNAGYKKRHGITAEQFEAMVVEQNGLCAICEKKEPLVLDHNHTTQVRRAALCNSCNLGLGKFKDNLRLLTKAIEYLKTYEKVQGVPDTNKKD